MSQVIPPCPPPPGKSPMEPLPQTIESTFSANPGQGFTTKSFDFMDTIDYVSEWRYCNTFTVSVNDTMGTTVFSSNVNNVCQGVFPHWSDLPTLAGRYVNFEPVFRFVLIGPPQISGKLAFEYRVRPDQTFDTNYRHPFVEWDFSVADFIDLKFPQYNTHAHRPVFNPVSYVLPPQVGDIPFAQDSLTDYSLVDSGGFKVEVFAPLQVPSIFPDSYTVLVLTKMDNFQSFIPTDPQLNELSGYILSGIR